MKLRSIEISGFRGFRDLVRFDIPTGFAVISGRNGVGKSTVCDAVEFVLTGRIERYERAESADSFAEYVWWRGEGVPIARYVSLTFSDPNLGEFTITRRRDDGLQGATTDDIVDWLCEKDAAPEHALDDLVRTSIVRDELVSTLRLDLSEMDRFTFLSSAFGAVDIGVVQNKAKAARDIAAGLERDAQRQYESRRDQLAASLEEVTVARDAALSVPGVSDAAALVARFLNAFPTDAGEVLPLARAEFARRTGELSALRALSEQALVLAAERERFVAADPSRAYAAGRELVADLTEREEEAWHELTSAELLYERTRESDRVAAALSMLAEYGENAVAAEGRCPLCDSPIDVPSFVSGSSAIRARLAPLAETLAAALDAMDARRTAYERIKAERFQAQREAKLVKKRAGDVEQRQRELLASAAELKVPIGDDEIWESVEKAFVSRSKDAAGLQQAIGVLEASRMVDRVKELENIVLRARTDLEAAENYFVRCRRAARALHDAHDAIERTASEMLDERLAAMTPVLNEFYRRLRPHSSWENIDYRLSGDVRRLLRLAVAGDLDPQFLFSSGQRRAAGLAFLLSLHMARTWSRWRTLILDDPVQHIDDYRALNLIEVLSALRLGDRQIIVAIEDEALADALCRRLRSTEQTPGARFELTLTTDGIPHIANRTQIVPLAVRTLGPDEAGIASTDDVLRLQHSP